MARKKQTIKGVPKDIDKLLVQKSNPLYSLWKSSLTLPEFKILDLYLSRIDSHHPEKRVVVFEKGELEKLLGVVKLNRTDLVTRLKHLMGNTVEVADPTARSGIRIVTLFEEVAAYPDDDGIWTVMLECTSKAMRYFFNVENLGYVRYKLRCITSLTSRYSYILFCYLEKNRFRKSWEIELAELKELLGCQNEETYKQFKYFNDLILKKCHKELTEKTECRFSYEPIKKGRKVVKIKFTVETLKEYDSDQDADPNQITIEDYVSEQDAYTAACDGAFSGAELDEIVSVLDTIPESKLPEGEGSISRRAAFLRAQYLKMLKYDAKKSIKSKQAYLVQMLTKEASKKPAKEQAASRNQTANRFNNFPQRTYDYKELERQLLKKQNSKTDDEI